jgi:tetratricopeptide (TPR) repeat protein
MSGLFSRRLATRFLSHLVLLAVWIEGTGSLCQSGQQIASIAGKVRGAQGQALPGATVTLSRAEDGVRLKTASTGADGTYRIIGVGYGRYRLSATMTGYKESASELINLADGTVVADFNLQPVLLTSPTNGGFMDKNSSLSSPPSFRTAGVEGTTAPSGYSAGASAEDAAVVMAGVSRLEDGGLSLIPPTETIRDCNQESDLLKAAQTHPGSFDSNHELGVFYFDHGDMIRSIQYLNLASGIKPRDANNSRWLSLAYVRTNQFPKAIDLIQSLVKQRPGDPAPILLLARIYDASGDRPKAIAEYVLAASLDAGEGNVFASGIGLVSLGAAEEALHVFSEGNGHNPASAKLWMGRAADLDPEYLPTYLFLATLSGTSIETDAEIRKRLEVLAVSNSESAEAHYDYALALWKHARLDSSAQLDVQIEAQLRFAIEKDPAFAIAHLKLGAVYEEAGDHAQAIIELERAVQLDPDNAAAHYRLAQAYRRNNQATLADLELARFKKMRSEPLEEDDTIEEGLRVYTARLARQTPLVIPCHEPR